MDRKGVRRIDRPQDAQEVGEKNMTIAEKWSLLPGPLPITVTSGYIRTPAGTHEQSGITLNVPVSSAYLTALTGTAQAELYISGHVSYAVTLPGLQSSPPQVAACSGLPRITFGEVITVTDDTPEW